MNNQNKNITITTYFLCILGIIILVYVSYIFYNNTYNSYNSDDKIFENEINENNAKIKEDFFGGYYYPYDYPYFWPYFYTGCNENVFGDINCLPQYRHPFW